MNSNEWPLVFFTVLAQLSAGLVSTGLLLLAFFRLPADTGDILRRHIFLAALLMTLLALIVSFLHLSRPGHAVYAMFNIQSSWLSREIILAAMFSGLLFVSYLTTRLVLPGHLWRGPLYFLTSLTGLLLVFSMVRLYMLPTVPAWNNPATPVAFFNTALLTGAVLLLALLVFLSHRGMDWQAVRPMARILVLMVLASLAVHLLNDNFLIPKEVDPSAAFAPKTLSIYWKAAQVFFLLSAFSCLVVWMVLSKNGATPVPQAMVYYAVAAVLIAEVFARYVFYAAYYRVGV